jgi:hypothetical protein
LDRPASATLRLERRIEAWLQETFGVEFAVDEALAKLDRLGVLIRTGDRLAQFPPRRARRSSGCVWCDFFRSPRPDRRGLRLRLRACWFARRLALGDHAVSRDDAAAGVMASPEPDLHRSSRDGRCGLSGRVTTSMPLVNLASGSQSTVVLRLIVALCAVGPDLSQHVADVARHPGPGRRVPTL